MKKSKITIRGKEWTIETGRMTKGNLGICDYEKRRIKVKHVNDLDTIIHELLHACFYDLDEGVVDESASDIAKALNVFWERPE